MTKVITNDGHVLEIDSAMVRECETLHMAYDESFEEIPLPNIDSIIMKTVQRFFTSNSIPEFQEPSELFPLMLAADYLGYETLLDEGAKAIAKSLAGRSPTEIRSIFGINP